MGLDLPCQSLKNLRPLLADMVVRCGTSQQIFFKSLQLAQATVGIRVPLVGDIVGGAGKVINGHHRWAQTWRAQPRGDGEVFVMVYG